MHCEYCGSEILNEASFCSHCGKKVKKEKPPESIIIEFIMLTLAVVVLFAISLFSFLMIDAEFINRSYENSTRWLPSFVYSLIFLVFIKKYLERDIVKCAALLIFISVIVCTAGSFYQEYENAIGYESYVIENRIEEKDKEERERKEEEGKRKEEEFSISNLKNKVYLSDQGISYNTETWKEDDTVYYSNEGKYTYRNVIKGDTHHDIYGVKIKGRIKNNLKYRSVKVKVNIQAKGEIESNCALLGCVKWGGKKINDTFTINVSPGGKNFSKYYDLTVKAWTTGIGITQGKSAGTYLESKPDISIIILK